MDEFPHQHSEPGDAHRSVDRRGTLAAWLVDILSVAVILAAVTAYI